MIQSQVADDGMSTGTIVFCDGEVRSVETPHGQAEWTRLANQKTTDFIWTHIDREEPEARNWVNTDAALDPLVVKALLTSDMRPRALTMAGGVFVAVSGANLSPGAAPEHMVSLRIWFDGTRLVSTRRDPLRAASDVMRRLLSADEHSANESPAAAHVPSSPAHLMVDLVTAILDRLRPVLEDFDDRVDALERRAIDPDDPMGRDDVVRTQLALIDLHRYLTPQREAIMRMWNEPILTDPAVVNRVREQSARMARFHEMLQSARDRSMIINDELRSQADEQVNRRVYALTIIAGIFLPLSFVTGLLGINVGGMPGADNPAAFWWVTGGLVVAGIATVIFLKVRRWI